ncbi:hypothetical protein CR513_23057, partial [Mucuna pruriens]
MIIIFETCHVDTYTLLKMVNSFPRWKIEQKFLEQDGTKLKNLVCLDNNDHKLQLYMPQKI